MVGMLVTSLELGLLYALVVMGVFLTFHILNFPDLTVDSSFVTGAAVAALTIKYLTHGGELAILTGFIAGFIAGSVTAFLHIRLGIGKMLSGILTLSMFYTINLRLMNSPNISLINEPDIVSFLKIPINPFHTILFLLAVVLTVKFLLDWFLRTEIGLRLRATGDNEATAPSFGININTTKFLGVALSNGLVGMSGALVAQYQGFADINMGIGTIILGLAGLMIGRSLISSEAASIVTSAIIIGAILYQLIINFALRLGLPGTDLKLVAALIVVIALFIGKNKKYLSYGKRFLGNS